ncbi:MAG: beta-ketoacyl-[acyl-carrier-protein] synthase family protein [Firmicutes bacterium]|nr:beta-ketoacyl-[acyl-carrier-protein] synthase family protein [Bacillota bacterium]
MEHVVITGMGIISPLGLSVEEYWHGLVSGRVALSLIPDASSKDGVRAWSAVPDEFNPRNSMDAATVRVTDPLTQWSVAAAVEAVAQSGLRQLPPERTAVILGSTMGNVPRLLNAQVSLERQGTETVPARLMAQVIPNIPAAHLAMRWGLHGPLMTISTACASSLDAIGQAARMIERGEVDCALAGGVESLLAPLVHESLERARAIVRPSHAQLQARPFDRHRSGFVMGEGAGMVVLEREESARARGHAILARIRGYGSLADGYHMTSPDPSGQWEARAMTLALQEAGLEPRSIDAVFAHGTGTVVGDGAEIQALNQVFPGRPQLAVTSVKGHMGHSMAASGVMALIAGVQSLNQGLVPPTMGTEEVDPAAAFRVVTKEPLPMSVRILVVNAFGFGGQNASLVLSRASDQPSGKT